MPLPESNRANVDDFQRTWVRRAGLFFLTVLLLLTALDWAMTYFYWPEWVRQHGRADATELVILSLRTGIVLNLQLAFSVAATFGLGLIAGRVVLGGEGGGRWGWAWSFALGLLILLGMTLAVMIWILTSESLDRLVADGAVEVLGLLSLGVIVAFWDLWRRGVNEA